MVSNPAIHELNNIEVQGGDNDFAVVSIAGSSDDVLLEYHDSAGEWSFAGVLSGSDLADGSVTVEELAAALGTNSNNPVPGTSHFESVSTDDLNTKTIGSEERHYAGDHDGADADARLDAALQAANDGETIELEAATYADNRSISTKLRFVGSLGGLSGTVIDADWTLTGILSEISYLRIENGATVSLNNSNTMATALNVAGAVEVGADAVVITRCAGVGSVTFESGTTQGSVAALSRNISVTDNGSNSGVP